MTEIVGPAFTDVFTFQGKPIELLPVPEGYGALVKFERHIFYGEPPKPIQFCEPSDPYVWIDPWEGR